MCFLLQITLFTSPFDHYVIPFKIIFLFYLLDVRYVSTVCKRTLENTYAERAENFLKK